MSPRGMLGGYQETKRELVVTSVSVGQSGGEAAEQGMEGEGVVKDNLTEWTKISKTVTTTEDLRNKVLQHRLGLRQRYTRTAEYGKRERRLGKYSFLSLGRRGSGKE